MLNLFPALILLILQGHTGSSDSQLLARFLALQAQSPAIALALSERTPEGISPSALPGLHAVGPIWFSLFGAESRATEAVVDAESTPQASVFGACAAKLPQDPRSAPTNYRDGPAAA